MDQGYVSALAAANRFLYAWQTQDSESGVLMLTDDAKTRLSEDRLQLFFTHAAGASYQITRGRKLRDGRYAFAVALFVAGSPVEGNIHSPALAHRDSKNQRTGLGGRSSALTDSEL